MLGGELDKELGGSVVEGVDHMRRSDREDRIDLRLIRLIRYLSMKDVPAAVILYELKYLNRLVEEHITDG